ncbi:hypothetical protein CQ020_03805 [Arthrobacter sp. MYb23]|uniref:Gp37-like protein n=1 Tax=unclassified Arthrobacter TaxID=235627 RepID=UPI000CFB44E5|nr:MULTISPECIES: hypothetical protein [unclassified Arthrobacter]PRB44344.1 hypothetical protein CQ038_03660 [Arthrobacter sp. MYb51]PRB98596.1 hypothetical protein CQ020_03805 [Arthrobacter sp. MYb23]
MTASELPFKITVYDKNLVRKAIVSTPVELRMVPRFNLKGTATFSLALDHPALPHLIAAGSRVIIDYNGKQTMSGPVTARSINGPTITGSATFVVEDDFRMLASVLGWPVPTAAITAQGAKEHYVLTGPAETVLKTVVRKNAIDRLGMNLTIAPDLGRGSSITLEIRMEPIFDKMIEAVEAAGLGITIKQAATSFVLDVFVPKTYGLLLSEESGVVQDWSWTNNAPVVTNVIVGGRGEGVDREFREFKDPAASALWGVTAEKFIDARDVGSDLNSWYSRRDTTWEARDRTAANYAEDVRELNTLTTAVANAANAKVAVDGSYPSGSSERSQALSDYNSATNRRTSQAAATANSLTAANEAQAELTAIDAEYPAIRAAYEALIAKRASEALTEGGEKTGIRMVLSETDSFRYGVSVAVGDKVSMVVGPNLSITDTLREAELVWTFDGGVTATPSVGEITDNPDRAWAKALRNSVSRLRKIEVK